MNKVTRIGLDIMFYLYSTDPNPKIARDLSSVVVESLIYTQKVLSILTREGFVSSTRGSIGGYTLSNLFDNLTLARYLRDMGEPFDTFIDIDPTRACDAVSRYLELCAQEILVKDIFDSFIKNIETREVNHETI